MSQTVSRAALALALSVSISLAADALGKVSYVEGEAFLVEKGKDKPLKVNQKLELGDQIKTGVELQVTPTVNQSSNVTLRIKPRLSRVTGSVTIDGQKQGAAGMPAGHPNLNAMAPTGEEAGFTGKVLETTNSGGYVFVRVQGPHKSLWAATQPCQVTVGDNVSLPPGEVMQQFRSASLNRTFEEILFVEHLDNLTLRGGTLPLTASGAKAALPPGHPKLKETAPLSGPDVQIAQPAGGHTVAEVFAQRQQLAGQTLTIKGRVMKFTPGIMGRNWMHLRDGTGTAGNNDLTVTTTDLAKVGDVVTMRGTLVIDQDFGGGYTYSALLEKAAVQKN